MAIRTSFTELFQVAHPLALAPMGGVSGGALAAAVSEAGGLGLVGGGYGDRGWLERELDTVAGATDKPWGSASSPGPPARRPSGWGCCAAPRANWITRSPCNWI